MKRTIIYLALIFLLGCSEEKSSEQPLKFKISEKYSVDLSAVGLSSMREFPVAPLENEPNILLIFNTFSRTIDSLLIDEQYAKVTGGIDIPLEGPDGIESFNYFIPYKNKFVFLDHNSVYLPDSGDLRRVSFAKFPMLENKNLGFISRGNSIAEGFDFFNYKNSTIYLFLESFINNQKQLISYELANNELNLIDFELIEEMESHVIIYNEGGIKLQNPYMPILKVEDDFLIISYPFSNKFHLYSLLGKKQRNFELKSKLFKNEKSTPDNNLDYSSLNNYMEISNVWQDDVRFGAFFKLGSSLYYRIIRGSIENNNYKTFIEVFDLNFNKVGETDLSKIQPDLGTNFIPLGSKIFVKAKTQENEDVLDYYLISISRN
jgi:hypothetical protein